MERRSTNENFEYFLRQNAEEFKMHPSPKVWDAISENLTKQKRRFYLGFIALFISASILGYTVFEISFSKIARPDIPLLKRNLKNNPTPDEPASNTNTNFAITNSPKRFISANLFTNNFNIAPTVTEHDLVSSFSLKKESWMGNLMNNQSNSFQASLYPTQPVFDFTQLNLKKENKNITAKSSKSSKFEMMFSFTPTVSYRKLSENKSYLRSTNTLSAPYNAAALYDVNNAVTHKPSIGLELGLAGKYALTKNVKLRGGLQFNVNRYDIKAFTYTPEVATIALNNGSAGVQSLRMMTNYRNFNGVETDWLHNFYFQVSTPIGAEIKLHGSDKMYIGAATTIQPTYILGDRAYLISADYKNYAQAPSLIRRWNVNTNLETFVAYSTGKLKWQVGPQVRYQLLSSFVNKYPVKENLFDFGLKVGISVNQNQ